MSVEGELGCLGSLESGQGEAEDGHGAAGVLSHDQLLTDPDEAERFVADAPSLDITANDPLNQHGSGGGPMSLREALVGMIHEYARHIGHADLLRERIDGRIGQ